jgi:hypothetical protein
MTRLMPLLYVLFFLYGFVLSAQGDYGTAPLTPPFFIDADVGAFTPVDYSATGFTQVSLASGYRLHRYHAIGLEYRRARVSSAYDEQTGGGLGAVYRFTWKGLYAKTSFGKVLHGRKKEFESPIRFDAAGGGFYQSLTLGYRFRFGLFVGASFSAFVNRLFDRSELILSPKYDDGGLFPFYDVTDIPDDAGTFVPDGSERTGFPALTLTVGYAFPGRGRKGV